MSRRKYFIFSIISLFIGGMYYLIFKSNTILENIISRYFKIIPMKGNIPILSSTFFKCYFCDFLWAFSLQCGLCTIFLPDKKQHLHICYVVLIFGALWEILQFTSITNGTGDFVDLIIYFLGSSLTLLFKNKTKGDYV